MAANWEQIKPQEVLGYKKPVQGQTGPAEMISCRPLSVPGLVANRAQCRCINRYGSAGYLCPLNANIYNVQFQKFEIKDYDTGNVVYQVARDPLLDQLPDDMPPDMEELIRSVKYTFPAQFLTYKTVRTALEFTVGNKPMNNFRMIEMHYFKDKLVRSYDFKFGFCIPNSTNSWESIYDLPVYSKSTVADYVSHPFEHKSDSFYFVDDKLIMHNKAAYEYVEEQ